MARTVGGASSPGSSAPAMPRPAPGLPQSRPLGIFEAVEDPGLALGRKSGTLTG